MVRTSYVYMTSDPSPSTVDPFGASYVYAIHLPLTVDSKSDAAALSTILFPFDVIVKEVCCEVVMKVNGCCMVIFFVSMKALTEQDPRASLICSVSAGTLNMFSPATEKGTPSISYMDVHFSDGSTTNVPFMFVLHCIIFPLDVHGMALILCISGFLSKSSRGTNRIHAYLYIHFLCGGGSSLTGFCGACFSMSIGSFRGFALKLSFGTDISVPMVLYIRCCLGINVFARRHCVVCSFHLYVYVSNHAVAFSGRGVPQYDTEVGSRPRASIWSYFYSFEWKRYSSNGKSFDRCAWS